MRLRCGTFVAGIHRGAQPDRRRRRPRTLDGRCRSERAPPSSRVLGRTRDAQRVSHVVPRIPADARSAGEDAGKALRPRPACRSLSGAALAWKSGLRRRRRPHVSSGRAAAGAAHGGRGPPRDPPRSTRRRRDSPRGAAVRTSTCARTRVHHRWDRLRAPGTARPDGADRRGALVLELRAGRLDVTGTPASTRTDAARGAERRWRRIIAGTGFHWSMGR